MRANNTFIGDLCVPTENTPIHLFSEATADAWFRHISGWTEA